jgi:SnoaL-like domain
MPWDPELFSAPVLARFETKQRQTVVDVPYFDGLLAGEIEALLGSFAGEPRLRHPLRGDIEGEQEFREFVTDTEQWLRDHEAGIEDVQRSVLDDRGFEEVIVHLKAGEEHIDLPHAMVADHDAVGRIKEIRVYFSTRPLTGHRTRRAPMLRVDPDLPEPPPVARYTRSLAAGDAEAVAAAFETDGRIRDPDGAELPRTGSAGLPAFFARQLADGPIVLDPCVLVEDGDTCALEYNVGIPALPAGSARAGLSVFVRGDDDKLAAVRLYEDLSPATAG